MLTFTEENYLKSILLLQNDKEEISVNNLSKALKIKMPTVNSMVKKLVEKKLVIHQPYQPLKLTELGKKEALLVIRKHRLTEMFLVQKMNFGWDEVHEIAEQVEHIKSALFFDKMDALLEYPTLDPHGSPIPDKHGNVHGIKALKLADCKVGETVELIAVSHSNDAFLKYLSSRNLSLGCKLKIIAFEEFDKSMRVSYNKNKTEFLSFSACEQLLVQLI